MQGVYPIRAFLASAAVLAAVTIAGGCGGGSREAGDPAPSAAPPVAVPPAESRIPVVVFLGDSLTAGYGLPEDQTFPALLESRLRASGIAARIVNAGVSGDTTAGGLSRLDWVLSQKPDVLVVGLGSNDGLRGQPLESIEANLRAIVERGRAAGASVLLLGMRVPTNYGPDYAEGLAAIYPRVAGSLGVELVPFLLDGVGGHPELNQADGVHPNARGEEIVALNVLPYLKRAIAAVRPRG